MIGAKDILKCRNVPIQTFYLKSSDIRTKIDTGNKHRTLKLQVCFYRISRQRTSVALCLIMTIIFSVTVGLHEIHSSEFSLCVSSNILQKSFLYQIPLPRIRENFSSELILVQS